MTKRDKARTFTETPLGGPTGMLLLTTLLFACGSHLDGEACSCPMDAHGALSDDGACMCLPLLEATPDPEATTVFEVSPSKPPSWSKIDAALAAGHVRVAFAPKTYDDRIDVQRTDRSEHRLILDGGGGNRRAVVPGILTGYEDARVDRTTVRGFEITGSRDKGIFWNAGDEVLIEDVIVHDNKGTPAINLQYSNRSGHASTEFVLRNSHVYNQRGECVYIGGSEGEDQPSHERVVIENNLIHDCWLGSGSKHDGINVKDRIGQAVVHRNVVFETDWGIEVASPGVYSNNLVFRPYTNGFHVTDYFGPLSDMHFVDNAVIDAPKEGFYLSAQDGGATGITVERATILSTTNAIQVGVEESRFEVAFTDIAIRDAQVGFDGWGNATATMDGCAMGAVDLEDDRALEGLASDCVLASKPGDLSSPAGRDGVFFTADDPWLLDSGAALPTESAR